MPQLHYAQIRYLSIVVLAWLTVFTLTRSLLLVSHLADANISISNLMGLYAIGMIYDLSFLLYATLPMALYLLLCPRAIWQQRWHKKFMASAMALSLFVMLFTAVAEWLFWDEFGVRFNFIAVDYLVSDRKPSNQPKADQNSASVGSHDLTGNGRHCVNRGRLIKYWTIDRAYPEFWARRPREVAR